MNRQAVVRTDAIFEVGLGVFLVSAAAVGALGPADFPHPIGKAVVIVVGCLLLAVGAAIWLGQVGLQALAAGNLLTAVAAVVWVVAAVGFSTAGTVVVAGTAVALCCLAALQLTTLRR